MATKKNPFATLTEEQKARNEEMRQQMRDQLAQDIAASGMQIVNAPDAAPAELDEVSVTAERPAQPAPPAVPNAETWRQDKLAQDIADSTTQLNPKPASRPVELREAQVVAYRDQPPAADGTPVPESQAGAPAAVAPAPGTPAPEAGAAAPASVTPAPGTTEPAPVAGAPAGEAQSLGQQLLERDRAAALAAEQPLAPPASLEESSVDPYVAAAAKASRDEQRTFAEYALDLRREYDKAKEDEQREVTADLQSAKWTGLTELAASIANMIGVGAGNAVSQTYRPHAQDWMQKADADMKHHRSRVDNLRQRQRETELKMQQLRAQGELNLAKAKKDAMAQSALAEYRRAQAALQNAKTETERQKAQLDAETAAMKLELMGAQTSAYYALTGQREAAARAALQNAASRASAVENQNANRDSRTAAQNERDYSAAEKNRGGTSGRSGRSSSDLIKNL